MRYESLLKRHLIPTFGHQSIADVTPSLRGGGVRALPPDCKIGNVDGADTCVGLRTGKDQRVISMTSDDYGTPCQISGAGSDMTSERPVPTIAEDRVKSIANALGELVQADVLPITTARKRKA